MGQTVPGTGLITLLPILATFLPFVLAQCNISIGSHDNCSHFIISSEDNSTCSIPLSGGDHYFRVKPDRNFESVSLSSSFGLHYTLLKGERPSDGWRNISVKHGADNCLRVQVDDRRDRRNCRWGWLATSWEILVRGTALLALPCGGDRLSGPAATSSSSSSSSGGGGSFPPPWAYVVVVVVVAAIALGLLGGAGLAARAALRRREGGGGPEPEERGGTADTACTDGGEEPFPAEPRRLKHHYDELLDPEDRVYANLRSPADGPYEVPIPVVQNIYENVRYPHPVGHDGY